MEIITNRKAVLHRLLNKSRDIAKERGVANLFKNKRPKITKRFFDELSEDKCV